MKFLLVKPHLPLEIARRLHGMLHLEPFELELVAGGIDKKHTIEILDLSLEKRPEVVFENRIKHGQYDIVGFTAYSNQAQNVLKLAKKTRLVSPQSKIIVGGIHATIAPDYFRGKTELDALVRGEGATAMMSLVEHFEKHNELPENEQIIPIQSPRFEELIALNPPPLPTYDKIPLPRRDLVDSTQYFCVWVGEEGEKMETIFPEVATVRSSMGCPHRCSFCVVHYLANGKYVQRTPEDVVNEIADIKQDHIYFVDDEMFINVERTRKIAELLKERGIKKKYISWARSDTIAANKELFKLWKEVGLSTLYVGMESMEEETLEEFNKGYAPDTNRKAILILKELGIGLHVAFMVNPDFEKSDFEKLQKNIKAVVPAEVSFTVFSPAPGTEMWKKHKDDFIVDPYLFYDCMHTILPLKMPMKRFYHYFSMLSLTAFRNNPWRAKKIKVPFKDFIRLMVSGGLYYRALRRIYKDYN